MDSAAALADKHWPSRQPAAPMPSLLIRSMVIMAMAACTSAAALLAPATALAQTPALCPPAAQVPTPEQAQAALNAARDHGFLWRVSKDGHSSWLYGTLHLAKLEWVYPGPRLAHALREADTIALELDVLDPDIQRRITTPPADAPKVVMPAALAQRLQHQIELACLPAHAMDALPPALQAAALSAMVGRWDGLDPIYGIDPMLASFGHGTGKRVVSLETPEQQAHVLIGRSAREHLEFIDQTLLELELGHARPAILRIAEVWARGDLAEMERYEQWCGCMSTESERALMRRLLDERNGGLADGIARLHEGGASVLAGVGSLHMIGPNGLPVLLAARGYTVERVPLEP